MVEKDPTGRRPEGFFPERGCDLFSVRFRSNGGTFTAEELQEISRISSVYGNGKIVITSRLSAEIPGIRPEDAHIVKEEAERAGLDYSRSGARARVAIACLGTYCVRGTHDTQGLAAEINERYYKGWRDIPLANRFKFGIGGCPNSCMKPSINDIGIEGRFVPVKDPDKKVETRYQLYLGGHWGRKKRQGDAYRRLVTRDELFPAIDAVLHWYMESAEGKERLGATLDRVGTESLFHAVDAALQHSVT